MSGERLTVEVADGCFDAYLRYPDDGGAAAPAVIVLQEIFGVNAFVRETCDWFAANGLIAAAPDLFWRQSPGIELGEGDREQAMALMKGLDQDKAVVDCAALRDRLAALPRCSGRVGASGYCLGGKIAYLLAARGQVDAAVSYYGVGIQGALDEAQGLDRPLLLHVAIEDALCPPDAQAAIAAALGARPGVAIEEHPAGHAFARTGSTAYVETSARAAHARTLAFLASHL